MDVVGQLDVKTKEAVAATQEAATQKALVLQITKKLDVRDCWHRPLAMLPRERSVSVPCAGRC